MQREIFLRSNQLFNEVDRSSIDISRFFSNVTTKPTPFHGLMALEEKLQLELTYQTTIIVFVLLFGGIGFGTEILGRDLFYFDVVRIVTTTAQEHNAHNRRFNCV